MKTVRLVAIIIVLLAIFALLVPVFYLDQTSSAYFGTAHAQVTADVSLTFLLFHCGSYINAKYTQSFLGFQSSQPISQGYNFACNFQVSSS
jgi:hypothetical protein